MSRVLLVRTDRLGDVILCTPAVQALAEARPSWHKTFLVSGPVDTLLLGLDSLSDVWNLDSTASFGSLVRRIRRARFDAAVFFRFDLRVAVACLFAGVRLRLGPYSNLASRLFLNVGMRQRRSRVEKHEAEYNLDLLKLLGVTARPHSARVQVSTTDRDWADSYLEQRGLTEFLVIHPGMGGSASNWPLERYGELARRLIREGRRVVVTVGPMDEAAAQFFRSAFAGETRLLLFEGKTLGQLGALLERARVVVAPSTGPIHVASALGVPVVGLYPSAPLVETSRRWGPWTFGSASAQVIEPEAGQELSSLTVEQSLEKIHQTYEKNIDSPA